MHTWPTRGEHAVGPVTCETDRARFLGRGRSTRDPIALVEDGPLSGTTGAVLDPIFALRTRLRLEPGAVRVGRVHHARGHHPRAARSSWPTATTTRTRRSARSISPGPRARWSCASSSSRRRMPRSSRISPASCSTEARPSEPPQAELRRNQGSQPLLWAIGISGDWPILLATIDSPEGLPTLRQLLAAHQYWRRRGMTVDLVVLNAHPPTYLQDLARPDHGGRVRLARGGPRRQARRRVRPPRGPLEPDELLMLRATARVHIACDGRSLGQILETAMPDELPADELESSP